MKNIIKSFSIIAAISILYIGFSAANADAGKANCDAFIYVSNNSLFEINLTIDGFPSGNLLVGKSKTYTINLANDQGKRIKVKVEYQDPDYIDPKAIIYVTKQKVECGGSDSVFVAFSK
ncbi:MAG TPA: hypothetical protein PKE39_15395 [Ignavibacteria bacterium]|nr:hypothetical protein [Ignavibacteria bacterium]HMR00407.1 hypothetical protein [Ignavibacteria bacterium]